MNIKRFRRFLDMLIFSLTIYLVFYGIQKGFDLIELSTNLLYFSALLIKLIVDFIYDFR